ncbi:FAD-binding oxidoreductase [Nocardia sp. BMG51109]|uniref:FAD-binding oxidoreductase n=1 Tax=Nocardia sp. BMG51109 TaxID=1056816 RepID=UPI000463F323|nr:FAD-binding protein [Nocardia sp. BMG51109]
MSLSRRGFVGAALGGAAALAGRPMSRAAEPGVVLPGDLDYPILTRRGYNRRFVAQPQRIHLPQTTDEVRDAVGRCVRDGLRIAVRSGGHCFDDFVDSSRTQALIDLVRLNEIRWDDRYRAFSVGAGAEVGAVYEALGRWGVTVPAGICKGVGAGGHISGGGYGPLSRRFGLVADHLYGVEIVTVAADGRARSGVATRDGPHPDLWWAHTGGGGGNFGVVTRFLLRSPGSDGADPARALPRSPGAVSTTRLSLPAPTEESFVRFLANYLDFFSRHREPGNRFAGLYAPLGIRTFPAGATDMLVLSDAEAPDAPARLEEFLAAVVDGVDPAPIRQPTVVAGYGETVNLSYYAKAPEPPRVKVKAAYLRQPYTTEQLRICYRRLSDPRCVGETQLEFLPFGGAINAVAPGATAMPARDTFMKMMIHAAWRLPVDDERHLAWARETYRDLYADTGGVPVPDARNGGSYINYPDPDLADPRWNASGLPWHAFYYGSNYPRLQRVKAEWDPKNIFHHELSVELPSAG